MKVTVAHKGFKSGVAELRGRISCGNVIPDICYETTAFQVDVTLW